MAQTNFDPTNKINISGPLTPTTTDTPVDIRTRIKVLADITEIPLAYKGMIVYCEADDKYYRVKTLKSKFIGTREVPDYFPDQYEEYKTSDVVDIYNYRTAGAILPLNSVYVYRGRPTHAISGYNDKVSQNHEFIAICYTHDSESSTDQSIVVYLMDDHGNYVFDSSFDTDEAETEMQEFIASSMGASLASEEYAGLMSAADKKKLREAHEGLTAAASNAEAAAQSASDAAQSALAAQDSVEGAQAAAEGAQASLTTIQTTLNDIATQAQEQSLDEATIAKVAINTKAIADNKTQLDTLGSEVNGISSFTCPITSTGEHSSNKDRVAVNIEAGTYTCSLSKGTLVDTPIAHLYVMYEGDTSTTTTGSFTADGRDVNVTFSKKVISLGWYINAANNTSVGNMVFAVKSPNSIKSEITKIKSDILEINTDLESQTERIEEVESKSSQIMGKTVSASVVGKGTSFASITFDVDEQDSSILKISDLTKITDASQEGSLFLQITGLKDGSTKQIKAVNHGESIADEYVISEGYSRLTVNARFLSSETMTCTLTTKGKFEKIEESVAEVKIISKKIEPFVPILEKTIYTSEDVESIKAGTIYLGNGGNDATCLYDENYYAVREKVSLDYASDLKVRLVQYDENKTYIKDSGTYAAIAKEQTLDDRTRFVRLATSYYASRGFSSTNPVTINDRRKGDSYLNLQHDIVTGIDDANKAVNKMSSNVSTLDYTVKNEILGEPLTKKSTGANTAWASIKFEGLDANKTYYIKFNNLVEDKSSVGSNFMQVQRFLNNTWQSASLVFLHGEKYDTDTLYAFRNTEGLSVTGRWSTTEELSVSLYADSVLMRLDNIEKAISEDKGIVLTSDIKNAIAAATNATPNTYSKANKNLFPLLGIVTDIHSDWVRLQRARDFCDNIGVDALLCLGDIGDTQAALDAYDWQDFVLTSKKPILAIAGNHEFVYNTGQTKYVGYTDETLKAKLYNDDLIAHNGEIHPNGKNYWHKDIVRSIRGVDYTLRIIGMYQHEFVDTWTDGHPDHTQNSGKAKDDVYYKQAQIDWLVNLLDSADANTHVMILVHWAVCDGNEYVDNPFNPNPKLAINVASGCTHGSNNLFIPQIIDAWINGANVNTSSTMRTDGSTISVNHTFSSAHHGQFGGYLCGHTHYDAISKVRDVEEQYNYVFNCTTASDGQQGSDTPRESSGKLQDSFAIIGYDFLNNKVSIVKIGSDVTVDMRDKKFGCNFNS